MPSELYAKAVAIRTSCFQLGMVSGPALGGVLYAAVGPVGAYAVAVALNVAWLVGTAAVILSGALTREGNWALILVGDVVLVFALLEGVAWRKTAAMTPAVGRS